MKQRSVVFARVIIIAFACERSTEQKPHKADTVDSDIGDFIRKSWFLIERCEEIQGCARWVFVEYCPSDYTGHYFTVCEGERCGKMPWQGPAHYDQDRDGFLE